MEEAATHPALGLECDWPPEGGCPRLGLSSAVGVGDRHRIPSAWTRNPTSQLGGLRMVALPLCLGSPFCKIGAAGAPPRGLRRGRGRQRRAWCQHVVNLGPRRRPAWAHARHTVALGRVLIKGDKNPQPEGGGTAWRGAGLGRASLSKRARALELDAGPHSRAPGSVRAWGAAGGSGGLPAPHPCGAPNRRLLLLLLF